MSALAWPLRLVRRVPLGRGKARGAGPARAGRDGLIARTGPMPAAHRARTRP